MPKARAERGVKIDAMRAFMKRLLMAAGCDEEGASISADAFLEADLRGIGLQGLDHMPSLIRHLRTGRTDPRARFLEGGSDTDALQVAHRVRGHVDAGADFSERGRLLVDRY